MRGREEIRKVLRKIKINEAVDEVPWEVWKYGGKRVLEWIWGLFNNIRRGEF